MLGTCMGGTSACAAAGPESALRPEVIAGYGGARARGGRGVCGRVLLHLHLLLDAGLVGLTRGAWRADLGLALRDHVGAGPDPRVCYTGLTRSRRRFLTGSIDLADSTIADRPLHPDGSIPASSPPDTNLPSLSFSTLAVWTCDRCVCGGAAACARWGSEVGIGIRPPYRVLVRRR